MKLGNAQAISMEQMDVVVGGTTDEIIDLYNACVDKLGVGALGSAAKFIVGKAKYIPGMKLAYSAAGAVLDKVLSKVLGITVVTHAGDEKNSYYRCTGTTMREIANPFSSCWTRYSHSDVLSMIKNVRI